MIAAGSDRFEIQRRLGGGGMGLVYQALDHQRGAQVALKTLRQLDSTALLRFKNEFRALADVIHPNLVTLYELVALGEEWFFTMEFVEGVHFIDYVRPPDARIRARPSNAATTRRLPATEATRDLGPRKPAPFSTLETAPERWDLEPGALEKEKLERAFPQVIEGVMALHQAGKLHRDLKPSNVLVTPGGRVVVCDFGLIADVRDQGVTQSDGSGTPSYMSPEQMNSAPLTEASDWYSVGIMLYEALTGRVPFRGEREDMAQRKRHLPPSPRELGMVDVDALDAVCMGFLEPDPAMRWNGARALAFLRGDTHPGDVDRRAVLPETPFVGRHLELARLAQTSRGLSEGPQIILVHAPSGMGKSALVRRFLDGRRDEGARVLSGRCFERESVPYRALDGVVDALALYLKSLPLAEAQALLGEDGPALIRLFPVLQRLDVKPEPSDALDAVHPQEARRKGWLAFRGVLRRLTEQAPLVIAVDDVQWSDGDSARLIEQLIRPPDPPRVQWIFCARREDLRNPVVEVLREAARAHFASTLLQEIALEPLAPEEVSQLAGKLTPDTASAAALVREAEGSPFLIHELARFQQSGVDLSATPRNLEAMLRSRVASVPAHAQELLAVLAVAGRPLRWGTVQRALTAGGDNPGSLAALRVQRLIKVHAHEGVEEVETYHDRIRETVAQDLGDEKRRQLHRRLALALSPDEATDAEQLVEHWLGAGEREKARGYAVLAAQRAYDTLAFEQAARLARLAIDLGAPDDGSAMALWRLLGLALSNGGRGSEAARALLEASRRAKDPRDSLDLRHLAGEQLLRIGDLEEGRAVLRVVLQELGLRAPPTQRGAILSLALGRLRVRLRGLSYRPRPEAEIPPDVLRRIDLCATIALGLAFSETVRGADFQTQALLLSLDAGEPKRIARALTFEATFHSTAGQGSEPRVNALMKEAQELVQRVKVPYVDAVFVGARAITRLLRGDWRDALADFEVATVQLREHGTGIAFEHSNMAVFVLIMLFYTGQLRALRERVPAALAEALDRGDAYLEASIRCRAAYLVALADDDPVAARGHAVETSRRWKVPGFQLPHHYQMVAESEVDLYEGRGEAARKRIEAKWKDLRRTFLLHMQNVHVIVLWLRAGGALSEARQGGPNAPRLRRYALRIARRIARQGRGYIQAKARLIRAAVADQEGDTGRALQLLSEAITLLHGADMEAHAAGAELLWGRLAGGEEGRARVQRALAYFEREGVKAPEKMIRFLCPGWG